MVKRFLFFLCTLSLYLTQEENDYTVYLDYSLEFPLTSEDFRNWESQGAAIFTKDKLVVNPEIKSRQGLVYNKKPLMGDEWMIDVQVQVGNNKESTFGTNGMGIFLLKEVLSKEIDQNNVFGYSNEFIGAAVLMNAGLRRRDTNDKKKRLEGVQGAVSDGTKPLNTWEIPNDNTCYFKWRNSKDEFGERNYNTLRLHYNQDSLDVLFYNFEQGQFNHCFKMEAKFSDGVYIALSGASGVWDQDFHYVKSLKTMNPNKIDKTHHAEEAKKMKGNKFVEGLKSGDLMHKNRLRYDGVDDLIKRINTEISKFKFQSTMMENLIRKNKDNHPEDQNHLINIDRIHQDLDQIMQDFNIVERMLQNTDYLIGEVEKRPPMRVKKDPSAPTLDGKIAELEKVIQDISSRTANLDSKVQSEHSDKKNYAAENERSRRQQLSEARASSDIPTSMIAPELHERIENSKKDIQNQTPSGSSWLKTLITWSILLGITYLMYNIYSGLKEEKLKY